jgi:hypothetical protein
MGVWTINWNIVASKNPVPHEIPEWYTEIIKEHEGFVQTNYVYRQQMTAMLAIGAMVPSLVVAIVALGNAARKEVPIRKNIDVESFG